MGGLFARCGWHSGGREVGENVQAGVKLTLRERLAPATTEPGAEVQKQTAALSELLDPPGCT